MRLDAMVGDAMHSSMRWPKAPNALGNALGRMIPTLRAAEIELHFSRNDLQGRRVVSVIGVENKFGKDRQLLSVAVSEAADKAREPIKHPPS